MDNDKRKAIALDIIASLPGMICVGFDPETEEHFIGYFRPQPFRVAGKAKTLEEAAEQALKFTKEQSCESR